jgi:hypothetical protein
MQPRSITPTWARFLIVPTVVGFAVLGATLFVMGCRVAFVEPPWPVLLLLPLSAFMWYVAWCGLDLVRSSSISASVLGDRLILKRRKHSALTEYLIRDVHVVDRPAMQLVHVVETNSRGRLFTVDYFYPFGMSLVRKISEIKAGEPGATDNARYRPAIR